jgi:hypothetical protein
LATAFISIILLSYAGNTMLEETSGFNTAWNKNAISVFKGTTKDAYGQSIITEQMII